MTSAIVACGSSTNPTTQSTNDSAGNSSANVSATPSIAFTPARVSLSVGGTVRFTFGSVGHNVFFDHDPVGAPATIDGVNANTSVSRTFPVAGVYNYYCHIHPGMSGTVVVGGMTDTTSHPDSSGYSGYNRVP
jgi:plastocyanin